MIKRNLLKNKDWNPSLIITPILLSFLISLYVLIDVDKSTETLGYLYQAASIKLENIYELGAFAVIVFLLILCVLPIGTKKILLNERPVFNNLSWGAMMFVAGMGASILWASPVEWAQTINSKPFDLNLSSPGVIEYSPSLSFISLGFCRLGIVCPSRSCFYYSNIKEPQSPIIIWWYFGEW